jgi:Flp pilus assembly pilin Flp
MMARLRRLSAAGRRFAIDENGTSAIEYGILVACIAVAIVAAVIGIGESLSGSYSAVNEGLNARN